MSTAPLADAYSPHEIAEAAGVPLERVVAALGTADIFVRHDEAVRLGRALARSASTPAPQSAASSDVLREPMFELFAGGRTRRSSSGIPLAVSGTLHAVVVTTVMFVAALGPARAAATITTEERAQEPLHLVFLATAGPGGGGGGGGLRQHSSPPKALREGDHLISSPIPAAMPPPPVAPASTPPEPRPIDSEPLPVVVGPLVSVPADARNRVGVLEETASEADSHGGGTGGGTGLGSGTGIGQGDGPGIGAGSGGGTGGGPFRPGAGIDPPRLLHEAKADYTEEARRQGVSGEVLLEIVVRRDGSVGDIMVLKGLVAGLNDRAIDAVRQWRFAPARRQGTAIDVIVEVAVEFKLR